MVIKGVKERYDELKEMGFNNNNSSFILCDCERDYEEKFILNEIIPLENGLKDILIDRENLVLTDIEGNVLLLFGDWEVNHNKIEYVNGKDILISGFIYSTPEDLRKREYVIFEHYHFGKELRKAKTLYDIPEGTLCKFEFLNDDTLLLEKIKDNVMTSRLYSLSKKDFVSPTVSKMEQISDKLLKFTDDIPSTVDIEGKKCYSSIIGFITVDGKLYNGVYDELSNKEIECELNSKPNFEEYDELRKSIQEKLDQKALKEANKQVTKNFILRKLENRAKHNL